MRRLAYLTPDRHLRLREGDDDRPVTNELGDLPSLSWNYVSEENSSHSWPTWSPSDHWLACFRVSSSDNQARVLVNEVNGISGEELARMSGRLPIYLQWCSDDERLAMLTQRGDRLTLSVVRRGQVGQENALLKGTPMFFTWWGEELAVFVGRDGGAQLAVLDLETGKERVLPGVPGNFCAPVALRDHLAYVARIDEGPTTLFLADRDGDAQSLGTVRGLAAISASPDGRWLAKAVAAGDSAPYRNLEVIDIETGEAMAVCSDGCLAFLWLPDSSGFVRAIVDTDQNVLRWTHLDLEGEETDLFAVHPTRDIGFYLRFFEQYGQSHPLVSPDGSHLLVAGGSSGDENNTSTIWEVPLDGSSPREVAPGVFAVYSWSPS